MVTVTRRRDLQQRLQKHVHRGRPEQIAPPHDVGDALDRVVDDDGEMIGCRPLFAAQHEIPPSERRSFNANRVLSLMKLGPTERRGNLRQGAAHIEPPCPGFAGVEPRARFLNADSDAGTEMQRAAVGIARTAIRGKNLPAIAKAGINEPSRGKRIESSRVIVEMVALPARCAVERDAEPGEILDDCVLERSRRARWIGILDSQQQRAVSSARRTFVAKRRIGVAEMQTAIGRGRETEGRAQGRLREG